MAYWLVKSEPNVWSWDNHVKKKVECWHGVRNYQARNNMRTMKLGDEAFFYHSNIGKEIVGIVKVVKEYYPDHTDETGKFDMVDFKAVQALKTPVTLATIKATKSLSGMALVTHSRLSVSPVSSKEWEILLKMGGLK